MPDRRGVITTAGNLPARYVIHTVGPVWHGGSKNEPELLASCYRNSLRIADERGLQSIAFPNISTGVYGYPKDKAAAVAVQTVRAYLQEHDTSLQRITFVCFDEENYRLYQQLLAEEK